MRVTIKKPFDGYSIYGWACKMFGDGSRVARWVFTQVERPVYIWLNEKLCSFQTRFNKKPYVKVEPWDTWNADVTLAHVILPVLVQFKKSKMGTPLSMFPYKALFDYTDKQQEEAQLLWQESLDKMIYAFYKVSVFEADSSDKAVKEGLELFGKHYLDLWE